MPATTTSPSPRWPGSQNANTERKPYQVKAKRTMTERSLQAECIPFPVPYTITSVENSERFREIVE